MRRRIAIIGTGISGLGAAWALHPHNDVAVFEKNDRVGGHSNTVDVPTATGSLAVDTGFIVYNEVTYPHMTKLFGSIGVPTEASDMSFSYSRGASFEYGASVRGVLAQPSNLLRRRFRRMLADINRFRREGASLKALRGETITELLERLGYSEAFAEDYLLPMTGAIWSAPRDGIRRFPARPILRFLRNHGLIEIVGRPRWRTVTGGSRVYVDLLTKPFADRIRVTTPVTSLERRSDGVVVGTPAGSELYDHVVIATHSDEALGLLGADATQRERALLGAIRYQPNTAVLHGDRALMPTRRAVWSSWNAIAAPDAEANAPASVTYWMNRLQNLDASMPLFVSLNPRREPDPDLVHARIEYAHPQFDDRAIAAQRALLGIQGERNTWYAGAYLGFGFHEDGLRSGLDVAAALGSPPPWWPARPEGRAPAPAPGGDA
jgi:predicted NAD/FAD-binding protein